MQCVVRFLWGLDADSLLSFAKGTQKKRRAALQYRWQLGTLVWQLGSLIANGQLKQQWPDLITTICKLNFYRIKQNFARYLTLQLGNPAANLHYTLAAGCERVQLAQECFIRRRGLQKAELDCSKNRDQGLRFIVADMDFEVSRRKVNLPSSMVEHEGYY